MNNQISAITIVQRENAASGRRAMELIGKDYICSRSDIKHISRE